MLTVLDPVLDPLLALLAAGAVAAQLAILVSLARHDGEAFVGWAVASWGARFAYLLIPLARTLVEVDGRVWVVTAAVTSATSSLALLASGIAYGRRTRLRRDAPALTALVALALGALAVAAPLPSAALALGVVESLALVGAGVAFLPSRRRGIRGARVLSGCLFAWAVVRLAFDLPLPGALTPALLPAATIVLVVQMTALVVVVLRSARQRVEFLKDFNDTLLDGMGLGLALIGPDLTIRRANRWMLERFGDDLVGRTCVDSYLARPAACTSCPWQAGVPGHQQLTVEGAEARKLLLTCSPLTAADGTPLLLELVTDITMKEAMQERLLHSERLATIGEMAARVAHEVRNPLGIMTVHADLARRELGPSGSAADAAHHLGIVSDEIRRVASLVETYLRFGRLPALRPSAVDLDALLDTHLSALHADLTARKIALARTPAGDGPMIRGDRDQLGQVFANLVRNAIEAMPAGGTLTVTTTHADGHVVVEVADTGAGIAPDDAERIFEPFRTNKPLGAGLGLAIAREIVQEHGGRLTCRNGSGGACFVVTLPVAERTL